MCDICKSASDELQVFLTSLQEKYPGTTVVDPDTGKTEPVAPGHHVYVASQIAAKVTQAQEIQFELELKAKEEGITVNQLIDRLQFQSGGFPGSVKSKNGNPSKSPLFGGAQKVIES